MNATFSIARNLATSNHPGNLWRRIALPISLVLALSIVLVTISLLNAAWAEEGRAIDRGYARVTDPRAGEIPSDTGLYLTSNLDKWRGTQFLTFLIEPVSIGVEPVLPPGVAELPAPGEVVVSPGLADAIQEDRVLADRFPNYRIMNASGALSPSDLIAYARPVDRELMIENSDIVVEEFNYQSASPTNSRLELLSVPRNNDMLLLFATICVLIPSVVLITMGLSASSTIRDSRVRTLQQLGTSRWWAFRLTIIEATIVALPVVVILLTSWAVCSARLTYLPIIDRRVFAGDFTLKPWQVPATVTFLIALIVIAALLQSSPTGTRLRTMSRPTQRMGNIAFVTMTILALVMVFVLADNRSYLAYVLFWASVVASLALMPGVVGAVTPVLTKLLDSTSWLTTRMVSEQLKLHASQFMRPFIGIALIVTLSIMTLSYIQYMVDNATYVDRSPSPSAAAVETVRNREETRAILQQRVPEALVLDITTSGDTYVVVATCDEIAMFLDGNTQRCHGDLNELDVLFPGLFFHVGIIADPTADVSTGSGTTLIALSHMSRDELGAHIRSALPFTEFPLLSISTSEDFILQPPQAVPWVQRGALVFIGFSALAALSAMVDQAISQRRSLRVYASLGVQRSRLAGIEGVRFAVAFLAALAIGIIVGLIERWVIAQLQGVPLPVTQLLSALGSLVAAGAVAGLITVWITVRIAFDDSHRV